VPRQLRLELRVDGAADPERVPRAEDVVAKAGLRDLGRPDAAAEPLVALEDAYVPPGLREQRGAGEAVDAGADDDCVVLSQRRCS
jgi:hypothetical protein